MSTSFDHTVPLEVAADEYAPARIAVDANGFNPNVVLALLLPSALVAIALMQKRR